MKAPSQSRLAALAAAAATLAGAIAHPPAVAAAHEEEGRLLSRVFLPEDYRGDTEVADVVQTPDGLIYAANLGALKEYDGRAWSTIPLPTGWIRQLAVDAAGNVCFAAFDEIGPVERLPDGSRRFRSLLDQVPDEIEPLGKVRGCVAHGGAVFWNTARHVLRWQDGRMRIWTFADDAEAVLCAGGTHLYLAENGQLRRLAGDDWETCSTDARAVRAPVAVLDGWAGPGPVVVDAGGALWRLGEGGAAERVPAALAPEDTAGGVVCAIVLRDGRLALSTGKGGLLVLAADGSIDVRFGLDGGVGLPILHRLFQDREGGLWMGTGLGAARADLDRAVTVFDDKAGIPPGVGLSVFSHDGKLHACGEDGLHRFEPGLGGRRGRFVRLDGPVFYPWGTAAHPSGRLVTSDKGLFRLHDGVFIFEFATPEPAYVLSVSATDPDRIFLGGIGHLWTARWDGRAWREEGPVPSMRDDAISMAEDREGSLWIGTPASGVVRVHRAPGTESWQEAASTRYGVERGLPAGHEWVSTYPGAVRPLASHSLGVSVYDPIADRLVPEPAFTAVGQNGRYVFPLVAAPAGAVFAQVGNPARDEPMELGGVVPCAGGWRWAPLSARLLDAMGFPGAYQMSWRSGPGPDGTLWLVTRGRIFRVDLTAEMHRPPPPPPETLLSEIARDGRRLPIDGPASARPPLGHGRSPLRVRLACPVFEARGRVEFQHRIAGFGDAWSPWSPSNEAEYTNLPPGRFAFEARARAGGGEPGPVARWAFTVAPPWWGGWPARTAAVLAVLAAIWGVVRWRTKALVAERRRLEAVVRERTGDLARERDRADAANRAKTAFLANMSHELRTPLHAILGYSQMLGADPSLPEAARARLKIVGASGHHLLRLINEVLDLSKIEAGKLELRPAPFDLPALLAAVAAAHEARAAAKGLAFRRSDPSGLPNYALGDAAKLRQVLENLLGNAIKFTVRGEVRLLALSAAAGTVRFEVSDTGPGIPPADLARLFQPFTQLAPAAGALAAEGGTGLGLAIAQRLAALMGGSLHVSSVVGQGSRFWFELPLSAAERPEAAKPPAPRITGYEGPRRRVLAVDDVEANRRLFVDLLAPLGFEVADAASAAETLARLETFRPDLVLLDLRLPDLDGFSLARRLRADPRLEGVKILAASASVFNQDPAEALAAGCDGFIAKPFLPDDFFARLAELLGLAWRTVAEAAPRAGEPLDPALLALLRSAAEAGDIVAMSEAFGQLKERQPGAAALEPIAEAIAAFDTAGVARLTEPPRPARE